LVATPINPQWSTMTRKNKMKILHGTWYYSFKQINKGMIKIFDTPLYKGIVRFTQKMFSTMGVL